MFWVADIEVTCSCVILMAGKLLNVNHCSGAVAVILGICIYAECGSCTRDIQSSRGLMWPCVRMNVRTWQLPASYIAIVQWSASTPLRCLSCICEILPVFVTSSWVWLSASLLSCEVVALCVPFHALAGSLSDGSSSIASSPTHFTPDGSSLRRALHKKSWERSYP